MIINVGSKGLTSEVQVGWMGQTSNPVDTLTLPDIDYNNQYVPDTMIGVNNQNFSVNGVYFILYINQVCTNVLQ